MDWGFDDNEQADMEGFSSPFYTASSARYLHSQSALPEIALGGGHINLLHANLHHSGNLRQSHTGQLQTFLQGHDYMSWPYQMGQSPHSTRQPQNHRFDQEVNKVHHQPISPISDVFKQDEDNFRHLHHPTPAYLPPDSFLLSSASLPHSLFADLPNSPHSSIKQEEEERYTDQASENPMSPLTTISEPAGGFMSQETEEGEEEEEEEKEEDDGNHQESDLRYSDERTEKPLTSPILPNDDIECDKTAPYAVLIHRALMSTPKHRMVLAEIYDYFREKIPRFRKAKGRGWMNSIRHNLSMNGAFLKEDRPPNDPGKGYIWVLSEEAIREGVKSTTRYRKSPPNSKKRAAEDIFLRSNASKRRRKSTRRWTTAKSRSHTQPTTMIMKDDRHERDPTPPSASATQCDTSVSPAPEIHIADPTHYDLDIKDAFEFHAVDYSNCYASFPHYGTSNTIYNEDDDWHFSGPGDQFSEEYTLVTQN